MEQLIELLKQIQDLSGVAIDALEGAAKDTGKKPEEGGRPEGGPAEGGRPGAEGGKPPGGEGGKPPAPGGEGAPPEKEEPRY